MAHGLYFILRMATKLILLKYLEKARFIQSLAAKIENPLKSWTFMILVQKQLNCNMDLHGTDFTMSCKILRGP